MVRAARTAAVVVRRILDMYPSFWYKEFRGIPKD